MVQWLLSLPRTLLVILILSTAIIFIIASDPPHTICRTQIENFKDRQKGIIEKDPQAKIKKKQSLIEKLISICKKGNSPGSCYALFSRTKKFLQDFKIISPSCHKELAELSKVRSTLIEIYSLIIRLAWGEGIALDEHNKLSWLSTADIALFCSIKAEIISLYGKQELRKIEQNVLQQLPSVDKIKRPKITDLALISQDCAIYKY